MTTMAAQTRLPSEVTPADLAELMATFTGVTSRLQETHETLHREVVRLKAELNEANEQLQRSRRLAALGEMAAGIAHEVRNPLGSIGLYARMLEQDLVSLPPQKEIAGKIVSAVIGLNGVVGDVLSFARDVKISPEPVEVDELLSRAVDACLAGEAIRLLKRGGAEEGAGVLAWCDSVLLHQALVNIIRNAIEAMAESPPPRGGHVLALDAAEAIGHDGKPATVLTVSDSGPGVSRDAIDRMFNPFFTTRKTGTGLGLAIVHRIVDAHGGRIVVWNNADRAPGSPGATFEIVIPSRGTAPRGATTGAKRSAAKRMQEAR
jgi:signal transduction histidine kinase